MSTPKLITVTGTLFNIKGVPTSGTVKFTVPINVSHNASDDILVASDFTTTVGPTGEFSIAVPSSNDPAWSPTSWTMQIKLKTEDRTVLWSSVIPYNAPGDTIALNQLVPVPMANGQLYALVNHTHAAIDLSGYVTDAELAGYVTDAELTAALAGLAPGGVTSVNLKTGAVTLTASDVGADSAGAAAAVAFTANLAYDASQAALAAIPVIPIKPSDHGFVGWMFDPAQVQAGTILATAGLSYIFRFRATGSLITNLNMHFTAGGTGLTAGQCFASLHSDAGAQLGITADQAANWAGGGYKICPLVTPVAVTPGTWYKARVWFNGTTGPTLSRGVNSSSVITNAGLSAPNFRWSTADAGLTTGGTAPANIGTMTGAATAWWLAAS